jgi:hypothetical protein
VVALGEEAGDMQLVSYAEQRPSPKRVALFGEPLKVLTCE